MKQNSDEKVWPVSSLPTTKVVESEGLRPISKKKKEKVSLNNQSPHLPEGEQYLNRLYPIPKGKDILSEQEQSMKRRRRRSKRAREKSFIDEHN